MPRLWSIKGKKPRAVWWSVSLLQHEGKIKAFSDNVLPFTLWKKYWWFISVKLKINPREEKYQVKIVKKHELYGVMRHDWLGTEQDTTMPHTLLRNLKKNAFFGGRKRHFKKLCLTDRDFSWKKCHDCPCFLPVIFDLLVKVGARWDLWFECVGFDNSTLLLWRQVGG